MPGPLICEPGGGGLFLPLFGEAEQHWDTTVRAALYLLGLLWSFLGVAIVADIFMAAIEQVTSKTRPVTMVGKDGTTRTYHMQVWNGTVANLTLMALGSSAPEILLAVIETTTNNFYSGDLGPSTIVGSAAYNLMCILAVCVIVIPDGESRSIEQYGVFLTTATFSVLAYLWLVVILVVLTPSIVTLAEGITTFMLFPILVTIAYLVDVGYFSRKASGSHGFVIGAGGGRLPEQEMTKIVAEIKERFPNEQISKEVLAELVAHEASRRAPKSRMYWRINGTRQMVGGKRVIQSDDRKLDEEVGSSLVLAKNERASDDGGAPQREGKTIITFTAGGKYSVSEGDPFVTVNILRTGNLERVVDVRYKTHDGSAKAGEDYKAAEGTLRFEKGEVQKAVKIGIIDDDEAETDEHFFVKILSADVPGFAWLPGRSAPVVVQISQATVTVYDDDMGGVFLFEQENVRTMDTHREVVMRVLRREGNKGRVSVDYSTSDGMAMDAYDYKAVSGRLHFEDKELVKEIRIPIIPTSAYDDKEEEFYVHLSNPSENAALERTASGKAQSKVTATVVVVNDSDLKKEVDSIVTLMPTMNTDKLAVGTSQWREQFVEAVTVRGEDEQTPPKLGDYIGHALTVPWKLLFALCPPTMLCDGALSFGVALVMIGVVTALIGDLAGLLGCVLGIPDAITAITLVALGTSLPDTFASLASAKAEPTADSSVGNVTGSNSVNVFLGLGLPWSIGAIFWAYTGVTDEWRERYPDLAVLHPNGGFAVPAGDLGFTVAVFTACALIVLGVMTARRKLLRCELGGPRKYKIATGALFVCLWVLYLSMSILKVLSSTKR
ncbi:hypothetical protein KFE25_002437 [Diacronema lutheri]|uniref:Calx-beta domain-containing protein n=2 Tax=Diacronema lutheri TaxID=2081491 RepID=A0A8J5XCQ1_DIALT|nr:hypothetical protein KFE25_002437 [Diacronema lutheri]